MHSPFYPINSLTFIIPGRSCRAAPLRSSTTTHIACMRAPYYPIKSLTFIIPGRWSNAALFFDHHPTHLSAVPHHPSSSLIAIISPAKTHRSYLNQYWSILVQFAFAPSMIARPPTASSGRRLEPNALDLAPKAGCV